MRLHCLLRFRPRLMHIAAHLSINCASASGIAYVALISTNAPAVASPPSFGSPRGARGEIGENAWRLPDFSTLLALSLVRENQLAEGKDVRPTPSVRPSAMSLKRVEARCAGSPLKQPHLLLVCGGRRRLG